jgi:rubrerythrin
MFNTEIDSASELLSIAVAAEGEAIRRYSGLAFKMQQHGNEEAAAVFNKLVDEGRSVENRISEWAELEGLVIAAGIAPLVWDDPNVDTGYDIQACNPYRCTPYKVLAFAVHNEERAFLFYTYVAADSHDADVCHHAKVLARAELDRAAALRVLRRSAWHTQSEQITESRISPAVINGTQDLLAAIVFIEQYLAHLFELAASSFTELGSLATRTRESQRASEKMLKDSESPGSAVTGALQRVARWRDEVLAQTVDAKAALRRLFEDCDRSFAFYNSVVKSTSDEQVMLMAQQHSTLATRRIAELERLID